VSGDTCKAITGVVIEARHLCMMMRGVEKQHSSAITSSMLGAFREKQTRDEFLALIHAGHSAFWLENQQLGCRFAAGPSLIGIELSEWTGGFVWSAQRKWPLRKSP
jgi:hypothetical protein